LFFIILETLFIKHTLRLLTKYLYNMVLDLNTAMDWFY